MNGKRILSWEFPLLRTHAGALLGNGTQGLMVWGNEALHITVGRAGFWDHRGGSVFANRTTFQELRQMLEAGDEAAIKRTFAPPNTSPDQPNRPHQIGGGRLELHFPDGLRPRLATLDMHTATLTVVLANEAGRSEKITLMQAVDTELAWLAGPAELLAATQYRLIPTWEFVRKDLEPVGVKAPEWFAEGCGFVQHLPADPGLALAYQPQHCRVLIATALGTDAATQVQATLKNSDVAQLEQQHHKWWNQYWSDIPTLALPDAALQRAWDYGAYKQAGLTPPQGVAATLQGPWLEEYQLPPWSCDYHFNINIQMIYWPALATNRLEHFAPLWRMVMGWTPLLRQYAEKFFACTDALMLPHAVDDRCAAVGQFWTGTIDHGCTAWVAQMAWLNYRYSMNTRILKEIAWPLLVGAFNGYYAMAETRVVDGRTELSLPVSVSPEYNVSSMDAWGRNASFQLAAFRCVAGILPQAAKLLDQPQDPRWQQVLDQLPFYALAPKVGKVDALALLDPQRSSAAQHAAQTFSGWSEETRPGPRICLWEGKDLDSSHRHPSHLASLYPFCTVDPADPQHTKIVKNSLYHWIRSGAGAWSGWAIPFVALIHSRCSNVEGAIAWLHIWDEVFTNEGHGTLHDGFFEGFTVLAGKPTQADAEIMQMDAGMGVMTAITELLVQCRGEEIVVLPVLPRRWRHFSFDRIRVEGAFQIGATVNHGRVEEIRVISLAGGPLVLRHHLGAHVEINGAVVPGAVTRLDTQPGETLVFKPA